MSENIRLDCYVCMYVCIPALLLLYILCMSVYLHYLLIRGVRNGIALASIKSNLLL